MLFFGGGFARSLCCVCRCSSVIIIIHIIVCLWGFPVCFAFSRAPMCRRASMTQFPVDKCLFRILAIDVRELTAQHRSHASTEKRPSSFPPALTLRTLKTQLDTHTKRMSTGQQKNRKVRAAQHKQPVEQDGFVSQSKVWRKKQIIHHQSLFSF